MEGWGGPERHDPTGRETTPPSAMSGAADAVASISLRPRKLPRQARSRATFDAIVDACGQGLAQTPCDALSTHGIAERAGVGIGTLYEYFPNRDAIVASLVERACSRLVERMGKAVEDAAGMPGLAGAEHLLGVGIDALGSQQNAFKVLLRDAPFVIQLPAYRHAREALVGLCQAIRVRSADRLHFHDPVADTWLLAHMLFAGMTEIAFLDAPPERRALLRHELALLTFRMAYGRDPGEADLATEAPGEIRPGPREPGRQPSAKVP